MSLIGIGAAGARWGGICRIVAAALLLTATAGGVARAEMVRLEEAVKKPTEALAPKLKGREVVVFVRAIGQSPVSWKAHEGVAAELTAALRQAGVEAQLGVQDHRIEALSAPRVEFTAADARKAAIAKADYLIAGGLQVGRVPLLKLAVWDLKKSAIVWRESYPLEQDAVDLNANLPEANRKVVAKAQSSLGDAVGSGECTQLASVALEAAGTPQPGVYTWGRELDDQEPILPGDILQLERVKMKSPGWNRTFDHHTAVVEQVTPDAVVVLHQNTPPKGKIVQRETWPFPAVSTGQIVAYRPLLGESQLPPVSPKRRVPAEPVRSGGTVDLLRTIDPRLDAVRGIWFMEDNSLRMNRDSYARLQVPFAPPERYTLRLRVERLLGNDQFAVGLVVGGHQTMCSFDAYGGTVSGLHLEGGKNVRSNPKSYRGKAIPLAAKTEIVARVTPNSVQVHLGNMKIVDWTGDPATLSVDPKYAMPHEEWLFLAAWNTYLAIEEFTLEAN